MKKRDILLSTSFLISGFNNSRGFHHPDVLRSDGDADAVAVVPDVVGIDKDVFVPVRKHGEMVMVAFVEDEFHFTSQMAVFFVIFEDDVLEINLHLYVATRLDALHFGALKGIAEELDVLSVDQSSGESVAGAFLLHDVDIEGLYEQAHLASGFEAVIVLHHEFVSFVGLHHHFVVHAFEDAGGDGTCQLGGGRRLEDINVFGAEDDIDRGIDAEALVYTLKFVSGKGDGFILEHESVQDVALADEVGNERVDRLVVNVGRGTYLLDAAFAHHDDGVAQGEGFFLVVGDVDEGDAELLVHLFQFHLHVLAHFQVESGE